MSDARGSDTSVSDSTADRDRGWVFWGLLRIAMGWIFLSAFLDKCFGLGFATGRDPETGAIDFGSADAWINGGSPTDGFLPSASTPRSRSRACIPTSLDKRGSTGST